MQARKLKWVAVYAVAMAYVEAAAVVYLRRIGGIGDLLRDVAPYDPLIAAIELGREGATLVMILAVGFAAGRSRQARLGFACFAFGAWDIVYYVWLRVMLRWPGSLLAPDILFLIPLPWWGPVLAPVLVALLSILGGAIAVIHDDRGRPMRLAAAGWAALLAGMVAVLYAFMADALRALPAGPETLNRLRPTAFDWPVFLTGYLAMTWAVWRAGRRAGRLETVPVGPDRSPEQRLARQGVDVDDRVEADRAGD